MKFVLAFLLACMACAGSASAQVQPLTVEVEKGITLPVGLARHLDSLILNFQHYLRGLGYGDGFKPVHFIIRNQPVDLDRFVPPDTVIISILSIADYQTVIHEYTHIILLKYSHVNFAQGGLTEGLAEYFAKSFLRIKSPAVPVAEEEPIQDTAITQPPKHSAYSSIHELGSRWASTLLTIKNRGLIPNFDSQLVQHLGDLFTLTTTEAMAGFVLHLHPSTSLADLLHENLGLAKP